jgi:hypothetical protein
MATTYLSRSITSTNSTWTFSAWIKRSGLGTTQYLIEWGTSSGNGISFAPADTIQYYTEASGSNPVSTMVFRDTSAWYHIVVRNNAGTLTFYVNGETITMSSSTGSALSATTMRIGDWRTGAYHFDGLMSFVYFIDGTAYDADTFGEVDSDTGEWKINTSPTVTMGTDGFLIMKNGNTITDQSTNSNDFTLGAGTLTNTEDCPDDVFATFNSLAYASLAGGTLSNGNNTWVTGNTYYTYTPATLGVSKGKFYWEVEYDAKSGGVDEPMVGITSTQTTSSTYALGDAPNDWAYYTGNVTPYYWNNNAGTSYGTAYTVGDVICVALDADNSKLYFRINGGSWENSGDPTSGGLGTGAISITAPSSTPLGAYFPAVSYYSGSNNGTFHTNFGNGYFGTTIISSEGTNASGIGKFEYDVPAGYTALSTKGLNE